MTEEDCTTTVAANTRGRYGAGVLKVTPTLPGRTILGSSIFETLGVGDPSIG